uniref:Autophagy-related protein 9 n=1 Tax=Phallusia mammillata TaxID=59560 RepID=A0A6F9D7L8_9ASCI|nr:autophagy-related protein 9A [Phallusia mammillata]
MTDFHTSYYKFDSPSDEDQPANEDAYLMHVPDRNKAQWHHIEDLDGFFVRVYQYHQNHGFYCIFMQQCFELVQFIFVVVFASFLFVCVDYDVLFANKVPPGFNHSITDKVTMSDAILSSQVCSMRISQHGMLMFFIVIAALFWTLRAVKVFYSFFQLLEIRHFYRIALHINDNDVDNMTWHDVQQRLMLVQEEQQMCIHKQQLTELDIYNRILRFKNYMIAMINKGLLPPKFTFPILGNVLFLTQGLKYNLELIFFWSPRAIFANSYHIRDEFKQKSRREELSQRISSDLLWLGVLNLVLSPIIFLWQILYSFLSYAEVLKREPGSFGARRWSIYARLYLRHFNELPHEFQARLNRGYKPASAYMDIFTSPMLTVFAKNVAFFVGSLLAVLLTLTVWDEDVLKVEHVLTAITLFTIVVTICKSFIPDEHAVSCPEQLMRQIIAQVHYSPDAWRGQAHTQQVRDEFAQLFQFKASYVIEELLSPIVTPFILIFWMRRRSGEIVDFFRNFTVDIAGVGDVCSFAQLDITKHGDPKWHEKKITEPSHSQQADGGKTELSLMHFAITNPKWDAPKNEDNFLTSLRAHAQKDAASLQTAQVTQNPLLASLNSLGSVDMLPSILNRPNASVLVSGYGTAEPTHGGNSLLRQQSMAQTGISASASQQRHKVAVYRGAKSSEGPVEGSNEYMVSSIYSQKDLHQQQITGEKIVRPFAYSTASEQIRDMSSIEMSLSALYMHELHHQRMNERHSRMMWETIPDDPDDEDDPAKKQHDLHSSVIRRPDFPITHQGYDATSTLTRMNIFGENFSQATDADVVVPNDTLQTENQPAPSTQPFLSSQAPTDHNRRGGLERLSSSDSDASPPQFHLIEHPEEIEETAYELRRPHDSTQDLYRPPEV